MKIKLRRKFKYTWDNRTTHEILPGEYEVPRQVDEEAAHLAIEMGYAVIVPEAKKKPKFKKKAPENKAMKAQESK
jgi:hypothetical protein